VTPLHGKTAYDYAERGWQYLSVQTDDLLTLLALLFGSIWLVMALIALVIDWKPARSARTPAARPVQRLGTPGGSVTSKPTDFGKLITDIRHCRIHD
jgi:hypothetical protein